MKIGNYTDDEILEFMTEGEGRGFLGRSMFDAMYFEIERLSNIINKIEEHFVFLKMNSTGGNKEFMEDILDYIKALRELKGSEKE